MADERSDIELIRLCLNAHREQLGFRESLVDLELRIVELRARLDHVTRTRSPIFATLYFTDDEMEVVASLIDREFDRYGPDAVALNAFRTALREAQYTLHSEPEP